MKFKQKIFLAVAVSGFCVAANAADPDVGLTINNNTTEPSTVKINHQICSYPKLGDKGITKPGQQKNEIDKKTVKNACIFSKPKNECFAEIFMTASCGDNNAQPIATAIFDPATGVIKVTPTSYAQGYVVTPAPYEITFDGGPNKHKLRWFHKIFG